MRPPARRSPAAPSHITHLFNGMPPFHHRDPRYRGAAADSGAYVELICDGLHLHPAMVRSVFRLFGDDRVCMISDSMRACGMPDGRYDLGGQAVTVAGGAATIPGGSLAGSVTVLTDCPAQGRPIRHSSGVRSEGLHRQSRQIRRAGCGGGKPYSGKTGRYCHF